MSNIYFRSRVGHIARLPVDQSDNKQLFLNIEMLDEAISKGRKVRSTTPSTAWIRSCTCVLAQTAPRGST